MKRILLLMVGAAFLLSVSTALGQNVPMYFNGTYDGGTALGAGAGFYEGSINGVNVGSAYASPGMICDDYYDHINGGDHWTATGYAVSSLNAGNIGTNTLFGGATGWGTVGLTAYQGYEALAYLANDMFMNGVGNQALQSSISQAMWYLTSNAVTNGSGIGLGSLDAGAAALVLYVQNIANLVDLSTYAGLVPLHTTFCTSGNAGDVGSGACAGGRCGFDLSADGRRVLFRRDVFPNRSGSFAHKI